MDNPHEQPAAHPGLGTRWLEAAVRVVAGLPHLEVDTLLGQLADDAADLTGADGVAIGLPDEDDAALELVLTRGTPPVTADRVELEGTLAGQVYRDGVPRVGLARQRAASAGPDLVVAMGVSGAAVGVMVLHRARGWPRTAPLAEMYTLAAEAGAVLELLRRRDGSTPAQRPLALELVNQLHLAGMELAAARSLLRGQLRASEADRRIARASTTVDNALGLVRRIALSTGG